MKQKILISIAGIATALVALPMFSAFEAHVVNVTARIENALFVHPESLEYGTVFPQEYLVTSFGMMPSISFSETSQRRVGIIDYVIKQKPKPKPEFLASMGNRERARDWCHDSANFPLPENIGDKNDPYYANCYPTLCPYLSKTEVTTERGGENDVGLPAFHDPETEHATGQLIKFKTGMGNTLNNDIVDEWELDLPVPCFKNHCAQDWADFVHSHNPSADPLLFMLPQGLEHEVFGCDIWVEVTAIR
jgi:hypothetical protein